MKEIKIKPTIKNALIEKIREKFAKIGGISVEFP